MNLCGNLWKNFFLVTMVVMMSAVVGVVCRDPLMVVLVVNLVRK